MYCANTTLDDRLGFGDGLVDLCIGFENRTNSAIQVTLPPGLIFISKSLQVQNGMLIERISFEVPAKKRLFKPIAACCINTPRNPASYGREFKLGPITNVKPVVDLLSSLETKDLHADEQQGAFAITALRGLANEGKISDFSRKEILKIKNK